MSDAWMIYGANGYTGRITAQLAVARGMRPILAGRDAEKVVPLGARLGLPSRVFSLSDPPRVVRELEGVRAVLHMAGPFSETSRTMVDACIGAGVHYLDITGEIEVFEAVLARRREAEVAGVALVPGVGFDVVPTDCLAAMLHTRLPDATELTLAFHGIGRMSRGTTRTSIERLGRGGAIRRSGTIRSVPAAFRSREIPFPRGTRTAWCVPWGDVSTAFHSTGIGDIECYMALPPRLGKLLPWTDRLGSRLDRPWLHRALQAAAGALVTGPTDAQRESGWSEIWGEVRNRDGRKVTGSFTTPEGYKLTADSSLRSVSMLLSGGARPGAFTPSALFGADFVKALDGVSDIRFSEE